MVTLTGKEIRDLANFAGFMIVEQNYSDELDTEITVFDCSKNGIKDEDENTRVYYKYAAYLTEYPDEGCYPLGEQIIPTTE